ncbi:septum formation protein Maf [bacterium]|nr:septum formation protein Maf [bacterium]
MLIKPKLLLASSSPRRRDILKQFGYTFSCIQHSFDETSLCFADFSSARSYVKELAKQKALSILNTSDDIVLTADTIVIFNNQCLGKPKNKAEASAYLSLLQGNTHSVISAFCLFYKHIKPIVRSALCNVTFNPLNDTQIETYITTKNPYDKAGGYGIQDCPNSFINHYSGSIYTIMGLPIYQLNQTIKDSQQVLHSL